MRTTLGRRLVALWLGLTGVFAILYAGFMPLPPVSEQSIPPVWWAFGAVSLAAALGVLRWKDWGRRLAMVMVASYALWAVWVEVYWMRDGDLSAWFTEWRWLNPLVTVVLAALALWWLVTRWPSPGRQVA
jgi:hypothetical protein